MNGGITCQPQATTQRNWTSGPAAGFHLDLDSGVAVGNAITRTEGTVSAMGAPRGILVSFEGQDAAGKTTVLSAV